MPTYEYKCPKGHVFEKFYPTMNDRRRLRCPQCGKMAERVISGGAALLFKGSGFYITDYKRAGAKTEGDAKPAESKSESKSESKPAAESTPKKKNSSDK